MLDVPTGGETPTIIHYLELRTPTVRSSESGAADMMRHLRTRQHLGKVVVICERPDLMLATARKQWMKLSRTIQKQRAMTLNADKILKYTHTIIHMQNMRFTTDTPLQDPECDVYFTSPGEFKLTPPDCFTAYIHDDVRTSQALALLEQLPHSALLVDYTHTFPIQTDTLLPKAELEALVGHEWRLARQFLHARSVDIGKLHTEQQHRIEAMDDALDSLLEVPHRFLRVASDFQQALERARPIKISKDMRLKYDALMLLAHRVQALTTPAYTQQFLESYNEDDTFFLYDRGRALRSQANGTIQAIQTDALIESLAGLVERHQAAGRHNIAKVLRQRISGGDIQNVSQRRADRQDISGLNTSQVALDYRQ